jgi:ribosomal protein S15P/S13E
MGQQSNKVQKRRRRLAYLERQKVKAKTSAISKPAAVVKKKPAPKKAAAEAAAE